MFTLLILTAAASVGFWLCAAIRRKQGAIAVNAVNEEIYQCYKDVLDDIFLYEPSLLELLDD